MNANKHAAKASDEPWVTISIPTMNSGKFIDRCLGAISSQTYKQIDINIIDGGSSDETVDIAKAHGVEVCTYGGGLLGRTRELRRKDSAAVPSSSFWIATKSWNQMRSKER